MAVGSDDTLTVWVNGKKVYDFQDRRGFDADGGPVRRAAGQGEEPHPGQVRQPRRPVAVLGGGGGHPADYAFLKGPAAGGVRPRGVPQVRRMKAEGKAERGRALFTDLKGLACIKCHVVGGQGGAVGPELSSVGAKYPHDELIAVGPLSLGQDLLGLRAGRDRHRRRPGRSPASSRARPPRPSRSRTPTPSGCEIAKDDIDERKRSDVSLMPNGLAEGLTRQDFADLIAYLETLKDKDISPAKPAAAVGR